MLRRRRPPFRVIAFVVTTTLFLHQSPPRYCFCRAVRNLRIASPLQALTIWDHHNDDDNGDNGDSDGEEGSTRRTRKTTTTATTTTTARGRFLPKCKAGARAESTARKELHERQTQLLQARATTATTGSDDKGWAQRARAADERLSIAQNALLEKAYDAAVAQVVQGDSASSPTKKEEGDPNQYQFVGVIRPLSSGKKQQKDKDSSSTGTTAEASPPITWYARKKPANAKWSVRLVHANRPALIQDLFRRGKIDIVAKYENGGIKKRSNPEATDNTKDDDYYVPQVTGKYTVRERTWKNLWNFRPQNLFKDPSGMYWRERRLSPGLYTDGRNVYEASYRYRDGRNGMHRVSTLKRYLDSPAVDSAQKERILHRLSAAPPDVVLEE